MKVPSFVLGLHPTGFDLALVGVLTVAGLGAALLLGLALAAFLRRQSRPYFLIALAVATLWPAWRWFPPGREPPFACSPTSNPRSRSGWSIGSPGSSTGSSPTEGDPPTGAVARRSAGSRATD